MAQPGRALAPPGETPGRRQLSSHGLTGSIVYSFKGLRVSGDGAGGTGRSRNRAEMIADGATDIGRRLSADNCPVVGPGACTGRRATFSRVGPDGGRLGVLTRVFRVGEPFLEEILVGQ